MDLVLGVDVTPSHVCMVLVEGAAADGFLVDHAAFGVEDSGDFGIATSAEAVAAAILGTYESASTQGHRIVGAAVAYSDDCEVAVLRAVMDDHQLTEVLLVDQCRAGAALAVAVGRRKALSTNGILLLRDGVASVIVVDTATVSIAHVATREVPADDVTESMIALVTEAAGLSTPPEEFVLVAPCAALAHLSSLTAAAVCAPEQPQLAIARGAALAYAALPADNDSTAGLAYSQAMGTAAEPDWTGDHLSDDIVLTGPAPTASAIPILPLGSVLTAVSIAGVMVLGITLAAGVSPAADQQPTGPVAAAPAISAEPVPQQPSSAPLAPSGPSVSPPTWRSDVDYKPPGETVAAPQLVAAAQPQPPATVVATPTPAAPAPIAATPDSAASVELAQTALGQSAFAPVADEFAPRAPQGSNTPVLGGQGLWPSAPAVPPWMLLLPRWLAPPTRSTTIWTPHYPY